MHGEHPEGIAWNTVLLTTYLPTLVTIFSARTNFIYCPTFRVPFHIIAEMKLKWLVGNSGNFLP